ncbi:unnamed protein product, partial [Brassica rapa subsp. narinosa]
MSRILTFSPSMTLLELQNNVLDEFFPNTQTRPEASLSYWPPNSKELATGISTPPVMLAHDGSVCFFYRHFEVQKGMNLFVTFNHQSDPVNTSQVAENLFPFTTPDQPITKPPPPIYSTVILVLKPDPEDPTSHHHSFTHVYPNPMDTSTPQSVPSTTTPHRRYPHGQPATPSAGAQRQTNPHGQSNFTPSGVHKSATPHVHPTSSPCTPTPRSNNHPPQVPPSTPPPRETRPLSEISDEEFDVPPLFDDLSYEAEDVPDLNWEDSSEEPFVGKLYATKQDCQIGLAIYAIKERFYFRQTRTTRHSFVLSCHDTKCD